MGEMIFIRADDAIAELSRLAMNKSLVYRGYSQQSELFPKIIRDKNLIRYEIEFLAEFEKFGLQYFNVNSAIDFMSYAQHFGLPTRLLDFTYNPFTALYFSLYAPKRDNYINAEDREYYYIRYCDLSEHIVFNALPMVLNNADVTMKADSLTYLCQKAFYTVEMILRKLKEEYDEKKPDTKLIMSYFYTIYRTSHGHDMIINPKDFDLFINTFINKYDNNKIMFIDANQCNNRIIMQQGLFMFPYILEKDKHEEILYKNTNVIKFHKDIRTELISFLETLGLNSFRLMPDLPSICNAINRKILGE